MHKIGNFSEFQRGKIRNFAVTPVAIVPRARRKWSLLVLVFPSHPPVPVVEIEADDAELPYLGGIGASKGACLFSEPLNGISESFCKFASQIRLYISCVKNQIEWLSIVADSHVRRV